MSKRETVCPPFRGNYLPTPIPGIYGEDFIAKSEIFFRFTLLRPQVGRFYKKNKKIFSLQPIRTAQTAFYRAFGKFFSRLEERVNYFHRTSYGAGMGLCFTYFCIRLQRDLWHVFVRHFMQWGRVCVHAFMSSMAKMLSSMALQ